MKHVSKLKEEEKRKKRRKKSNEYLINKIKEAYTEKHSWKTNYQNLKKYPNECLILVRAANDSLSHRTSKLA